jgi:hypothetical protein
MDIEGILVTLARACDEVCDEHYSEPLWLALDGELTLDNAREAVKAVRERIKGGHPEHGMLKGVHQMNLQWAVGTAMEDLKRLKHPGWTPLRERLNP